MMHSIKCLVAAASGAAFLALAACQSEPETIVGGPADPQAAELAKKAPVALPPSIVSSHAYRCKDNSLVYVDFLSDQKTAVYRTKRGADATLLTAAQPGQPYTADGGYSVTGGGTQISVTAPGKGTQSCKA